MSPSQRRAVGDTWISKAWFDFLPPITLLNGIADIPIAKRSMIRLLVIRCLAVVVIHGDAEDEQRTYGLASALKLLSGLSLDHLVVQGTTYIGDDFKDGCGSTIDYLIINDLITEADGWKELHFLYQALARALLGSARPAVETTRAPAAALEPGSLGQRRPLRRSKNASVTIYRHTASIGHRFLEPDYDQLQSDICKPYHQEWPPGMREEYHGWTEDTFLMQLARAPVHYKDAHHREEWPRCRPQV